MKRKETKVFGGVFYLGKAGLGFGDVENIVEALKSTVQYIYR
jgi:hypothetical protein